MLLGYHRGRKGKDRWVGGRVVTCSVDAWQGAAPAESVSAAVGGCMARAAMAAHTAIGASVVIWVDITVCCTPLILRVPQEGMKSLLHFLDSPRRMHVLDEKTMRQSPLQKLEGTHCARSPPPILHSHFVCMDGVLSFLQQACQ